MLNLLARTTFLGGVIVLAAYHNANFKSTNSARQECVLYRDVQNLTLIGTRFRSDLESTCVCRCELIKIGLWTDALGHLEIPTMQFYNGDPNNLTFLENVRECVSEIPPNLDLCYRAFKYYKCYVSYFGDVNLDLPRFVPSTDLQQQQTVVDCARILQISHQDLRSMAATTLLESTQSKCLLRCFLIRQGFFSDETGPNRTRLFAQFATVNDERSFRYSFGKCYQRLQDESWDRCSFAARIVTDCLSYTSVALEQITAAIGAVAHGGGC